MSDPNPDHSLHFVATHYDRMTARASVQAPVLLYEAVGFASVGRRPVSWTREYAIYIGTRNRSGQLEDTTHTLELPMPELVWSAVDLSLVNGDSLASPPC